MVARKLLLVGVAGLLVVLVSLQLWSLRNTASNLETAQEMSLAQSLPKALKEFTVHDEPIAGTEEMKRAVGELLNYNDAVYRIYQGQNRRLSIYIARWEAGRMSPRIVASHTPDICWPLNGWKRDKTAEAKLLIFNKTWRDAEFAEGETRVFVAQAKPEYVVFWHRVGDQILSYNTGQQPPWWAWLDELRRDGLKLKQSQLFVRISSDVSLEKLWGEPETEPLRTALLKLGLKQN